MRDSLFGLIVWILLLGMGGGQTVWGQNNRFTDRAFLPSPVVRGMGDAGGAVPGIEQAFFYNPAHLPHVTSHFTILGVQGAASPSIDEQVQFYNEDVKPASGDDNSLTSEQQAALLRETDALRPRPSRGHGAVLLPSFVYAPGALAVGGGVFAKTGINYRIVEGRRGAPKMHLLSRTDVLALAAVGLDLRVIGLSNVTVGLTGTQTRRFLAFKRQPLDPPSGEGPDALLNGSVFDLDAGMVYRPDWWGRLPGTLRFGGALYDLLGRGYDYSRADRSGRMPFLGVVVEPSAGERGATEAEVARQRFALAPSYRVGTSYQYPTLFFMDDVAVALDYQGYGTGGPAPLSRLHFGVRAEIVDPVRLRGGVSSGYLSGGLGVEVGAFHFDYALHGAEAGQRHRERRTLVHTARLLLRLE